MNIRGHWISDVACKTQSKLPVQGSLLSPFMYQGIQNVQSPFMENTSSCIYKGSKGWKSTFSRLFCLSSLLNVRAEDWVHHTPQFMAHCFPWLQERPLFYFTFYISPCPLLLFPSPSPTGHVSNMFDVYFFNGTTHTLHLPISVPVLQSPLPIFTFDHNLMSALVPSFTCLSASSLTISFLSFPAGFMLPWQWLVTPFLGSWL